MVVQKTVFPLSKQTQILHLLQKILENPSLQWRHQLQFPFTGLGQCPSWSYRASFDGKGVVGLQPTFADGPAATDNFHLLGLPGLPLVVSMGTTLLPLIKLGNYQNGVQQRQPLFLSMLLSNHFATIIPDSVSDLKSRCHVPLLFVSLLGCNGHL